jgi:hypothetical protein
MIVKRRGRGDVAGRISTRNILTVQAFVSGNPEASHEHKP